MIYRELKYRCQNSKKTGKIKKSGPASASMNKIRFVEVYKREENS